MPPEDRLCIYPQVEYETSDPGMSPRFPHQCAFFGGRDEQEHEVFTAVLADGNEHGSNCHLPPVHVELS